MPVIDTVLTWALKRHLTRIEEVRTRPHELQANLLQYLLHTAQHTAWGREYGYAEGLSAAEFARRVPVSSYEQLYPRIEQVMRGEADVLWPGRVEWFAKSSGTTNARSKYIPVTAESLENCHYRAGRDMVALANALYPEASVLSGKTLALGGSLAPNPERPDAADSCVGDVSAIIMRNLPLWARHLRTPSLEVALLGEWEEKLERMARQVLQENVITLAGVPTWMIVLLRRVVELSGRSIPEIWPNLRLFLHGAVAFGPYRELFHQLIPDERMRYLEIYNASEGYLAFQDQPDNPDLLLLLDHGIYYEFIPVADMDQPNPRTLTLDEVEVGQSYALVISTNAGLWRYQIGDTVRFVSKEPYRIRIAGRTKHFLNAFGEEVVVENAEAAVAAAAEATGALVQEFTAAPIYFGTEAGSRGGHQWLVEFAQPPADTGQFAAVLDSALRELNSDYDAKRYRDLALRPPVLTVAQPGTFQRWLARHGKLGGQHKVPRLSNSRTLLDELLTQLAE